jgi:hypothetical protein
MGYWSLYLSIPFLLVSNLVIGQNENLLDNSKYWNDKVNQASVIEILSKHPWNLIRIDSTCFDQWISSNKVSSNHLMRIQANGKIESLDKMFVKFLYIEAKKDIYFYNAADKAYCALSLNKSEGTYFMTIRPIRGNDVKEDECIMVGYTFKQMVNKSLKNTLPERQE